MNHSQFRKLLSYKHLFIGFACIYSRYLHNLAFD